MRFWNLFGKIRSYTFTTARKRARAGHRRHKILTTNIAKIWHSYTIIQLNIYTSILQIIQILEKFKSIKSKIKKIELVLKLLEILSKWTQWLTSLNQYQYSRIFAPIRLTRRNVQRHPLRKRLASQRTVKSSFVR